MIMLVGCSDNSEKYIQELNDNSNMGAELLQDSGLTEKEAKRYNADMPYIIYIDDKDTKYYCFRYPDEEAPLTITQIEIHDEEYDVFGIHLGDNVEDGIDILKDYGYKREDFPVNNTYLYTKGDVNVILDYEGDTITEIVASLSTDTEDGVKY